ncbi:hypothetical protein [Methylotuvimicrobium buryatense]|uniref:hypothetical protein n=1 Tax=Methylotuvimicrobium buryatense TaxID=95641 RepID=UPI00163E9C3E|nr:hypothetical protein [Methylotuvimicrobium buryatense]
MNTKNRLCVISIVEFFHPSLIIQKRRALREEHREGAQNGIFYPVFPIVAGFTGVR